MIKFCRLSCVMLFCISEAAYGAAKIVKELPSELIAEASASYVLGDNDTRIDARNIALNEAKRAASELVGTHVKSELVIENDQVLRDQITVVAAAFLRVEVIKEEMTVSKEHRSIMQITIRAYLDKTSIRSKIDSYRSDAKRQGELRELQDENSRLQNELEALNTELSKGNNNSGGADITTKSQVKLIDRRDTVISHLDENQGHIRRVFEQGALLSLAKKSGDDYNSAVEFLDREFFGYIKNNTKVEMAEPQFIDNGNGTYDVLVGVTWSIGDPEPAESALGEYFELDPLNVDIAKLGLDYSKQHHTPYFAHPWFYVKAPTNFSHIKQERPYSQKLWAQFARKRIAIRIELGNKSEEFHITTIDTSMYGGRLIWVQRGTGVQLYGQNNPVVIKSVPEAMLKNQTALNAKVLVIDLPDKPKK